MTQGAPDSPGQKGTTGLATQLRPMTEKTQERGEKRGVLSTGRAKQLDKEKDADAESNRANDDDDEG